MGHPGARATRETHRSRRYSASGSTDDQARQPTPRCSSGRSRTRGPRARPATALGSRASTARGRNPAGLPNNPRAEDRQGRSPFADRCPGRCTRRAPASSPPGGRVGPHCRSDGRAACHCPPPGGLPGTSRCRAMPGLARRERPGRSVARSARPMPAAGQALEWPPGRGPPCRLGTGRA